VFGTTLLLRRTNNAFIGTGLEDRSQTCMENIALWSLPTSC
jgi:hypothetical protein